MSTAIPQHVSLSGQLGRVGKHFWRCVSHALEIERMLTEYNFKRLLVKPTLTLSEGGGLRLVGRAAHFLLVSSPEVDGGQCSSSCAGLLSGGLVGYDGGVSSGGCGSVRRERGLLRKCFTLTSCRCYILKHSSSSTSHRLTALVWGLLHLSFALRR